VDAYDPAANSWSSLEALPVPRHGHAGAVVGNRLHVVGGIAMDPAEGGAAGAKKETDLHEALEVER
jgi:hypothetical protein